MKKLLLLPVLFELQLPAQLPQGAASAITNNGVSLSLDIAEPGNHVWVLQRSSNLTTWTDLETLKLHNGRFRRNVSLAGLPAGQFYRFAYDSASQPLTSTTATALLLPATTPNYASPALPAPLPSTPSPRRTTRRQETPRLTRARSWDACCFMTSVCR